MLVPIYGFLQGDTLGLLILARADERVGEVAERLQASAAIRVARRERVLVIYRQRVLDPQATVAEVGIQPLDRLDVRAEEG